MRRRPGQRVEDAFTSAVAEIERRADLDRAWTEATELAATADRTAAQVTALRGRLARRIRDRDQLALEPLSRRLSLSKSRTFQLTREDSADA